MPLQATSGAASYDAFGGGAAAVPNYIEDVFSTYLYTGNGSTQTITNGIDLSTKGGLVWGKDRTRVVDHSLYDTARGVSNYITTDSTGANVAEPAGRGVTSFNTTGFSLGTDSSGSTNDTGQSYVSWTFRKQPKFFDVVTYTGTGSNTTIAHSLGSVPGSIIVKRTDTTAAWAVYHRSLANTQYLVLNTTAAAATGATWWNSTTPTSTVFSVGTDASVNASGGTYVAYLFAHDAGGFGLTGTDNVISCGSFTATGSAQTVTLGYEPQWVLVKSSNNASSWYILDNMRGLPVSEQAQRLYANTSGAEGVSATLAPTATGFSFSNTSDFANAGYTYIYIAIRRGPMKVPTLGTSVFSPVARAGTGATATVTSGFPVSSAWISARENTVSQGFQIYDRLRGANARLSPPYTQQEYSTPTNELTSFASNTSVTLGASTPDRLTNYSGENYINYFFQRAPGFFDEVCDSGTGGTKTITHNLGVAPELWIRKRRDSATYGNWYTYTSALGNTKYLILETTAAQATATADVWNLTTPTATTLYVGGDLNLFGGGAGTYVNYLFATCAGVSKVGSYTGTATTKQIDCGFTGGARFVLIKRTDATGDWYVWDSARGIVAGNDPYLLLNSTAAEVTSTDYVDTYSAGFEISSTAPAAINASGGSFIFLAIA